MKSFSEFNFTNGLLFDYSNNKFPTKLHAWDGNLELHANNSTFFGYVFTGESKIESNFNNYHLIEGQYFSCKEKVTIQGGKGIVIEKLNYRGMETVGGPVEDKGRLKYIDGCTDSLLIPPVKRGDPCLNALFFPENIDQTSHTHPSMRVGMIIKGQGICVTDKEEYELHPGKVFIIHEEGHHKFKTAAGKSMVVIAYHPDSDFGPVDENHPMINRTIVEGVSAAKIKEIQTR